MILVCFKVLTCKIVYIMKDGHLVKMFYGI